MEPMDNDEYNHFFNTFNQYSMIELLNLCEKHKLNIYGNREIIVDRLAYYFSEGHRKNSIRYKLKECYNSIINNIFYTYTSI